MATINGTYATIADLVKAKNPNGSQAKVVEVLMQQTPMLEDIPFREGNLDTGHRVTSRTALPTIEWRRINKGYNSSKGKTDQVDEACGSMVGKSVIDTKLVELNGGLAYRAGQDMAFTQSFKHEFETGLIYHSTKTAPEKFMGLAGRFDSTSAPQGNQIFLHDPAAAGSDQTSIWIVGWGDNSVYGITPKGSTGGLKSKDMGIHYVDDGSGTGATYSAFITEWGWDVGLCVEDWRYVVRIANIDTSNLADNGNALIKSVVRALEEKMYSLEGGIKPVIYVNRKIGSFWRLQAMDSVKNATLTLETVGGKRVLMFDGIPVRRTDALLNTEAPIS
jgi:hypothetical protein